MSVNNLNPINQKIVQQKTIENQEKAVQNSATVPVKKINKKKLAVGIAAGIGITALVVGGILYNKKINSETVKKLAEHIDFSEASTLEEAVEFGRKNLGIKKYKGFKDADLDVVNWVNEGLVRINNTTKGKAVMPKKVLYKTLEQTDDLIAGGSMNAEGTMIISKNAITDLKESVTEIIKSMTKEQPEKAEEIINGLNKKNNFKEWQNTCIKIFQKYPDTAEKLGGQTHISTFSTINHEIGHLQHFTNTNSNPIDLDSKFADLFNKSKDIAKKVSNYATTSPVEFVAECYSKMIDGIKLDDDVLDLYQKLGGVMI